MKIFEARQLYSAQIRAYQEQKTALMKQKQELEKKIKLEPEEKNVYEKESVILELSLKAVDEKQSEYQEYMSKLSEQWAGMANMVAAEQQGEAMEEYTKDMGKVMEVARRLMKGAIVPANDEKKLMEYSMELYQAAKNIGSMVAQREKEKYESLWKDEEEKGPSEDPTEVADHTEAFAAGPEIVEVADTMASVSVPE